MPELVDLTDDQLAAYSLKWVYDFGGRSLRYRDSYEILGALFEDLEGLFDEGHSDVEILRFLHEIADDADEEEEAKEQWRIRHPIKHAVARVGWHLQMWGSRPWRESIQ
jgi:hypothetical protein